METGQRLDSSSGSVIRDEEISSIGRSQTAAVPAFTPEERAGAEAEREGDPGAFSFFDNARLSTKQWMTALGVGIVTAVVVASGSRFFHQRSLVKQDNLNEEMRSSLTRRIQGMDALISALAGVLGGSFVYAVGRKTTRQIQHGIEELRAAFETMSHGDFNTYIPSYGNDEFGQLARQFNQMARAIASTTREAQRKAEENESAKEDLQRQVIRLLDDVEGAARGDLTVSAEVTADVLGAVADSFNLTIQNTREIVQQVKQGARQVGKESMDSSQFAQQLSADALRQAEELAATINSIQAMTDAIKRVADASKEAEAVSRSSAEIALKGGEAVESTVAGILAHSRDRYRDHPQGQAFGRVFPGNF